MLIHTKIPAIFFFGLHKWEWKNKIQTTAVTMELTFRSCRRGMTGEFSLDLEGLSVTGGERLCDANCVNKFNLLMSGSLSIRLKETPQEMFTR